MIALTMVGTSSVPAIVEARRLTFLETWAVALPDRGAPVALSSPNLAVLGGGPAVVVGDLAGHVYALSLAKGSAVPGWPVSTSGAPVESTPSVAALTPGSRADTIFVGVGSAAKPHSGGYEAFNPDGSERWFVRAYESLYGGPRRTEAVQASTTVGNIQGSLDVVAPSLGQEEYALNASTGAVLRGFPWFTSDSGFSTPALADLYGNGKIEIIEGSDQTQGASFGVAETRGGHLRVLAPTGNLGTRSPSGGLKCQYNTDQVVQSSPAVGPFLARGAEGIVVGTGTFWPHATATDKLFAFNARCRVIWVKRLDGATTPSPALADLMGNGHLDVVEGTYNGPGRGSVYALSGPTGAVLWYQRMPAEVIGSVVTADLGAGYQDVIVATTDGAEVLDGRTGEPEAFLAPGEGLQGSPLVTDDPNGTLGVTLAGYNGYHQGLVEHYELKGSNGAEVDQVGAWPMFHHDPQLSGNAATPLSGLQGRPAAKPRRPSWDGPA